MRAGVAWDLHAEAGTDLFRSLGVGVAAAHPSSLGTARSAVATRSRALNTSSLAALRACLGCEQVGEAGDEKHHDRGADRACPDLAQAVNYAYRTGIATPPRCVPPPLGGSLREERRRAPSAAALSLPFGR
jgi:hypothetical protein